MARGRSPSPAEPPSPPSIHIPSKRDKRRTMLADRLNEMIASFSQDRDLHYRAQITAIQTDMNLIMQANVGSNTPLDDSGEEISEQIMALTGGNPQVSAPQNDYIASVGRHYSKFVDDVNDAMEARDLGLTMLWNKYQSHKQEREQLLQYKVKLAQEEHQALSDTLRERLVQKVTSKRGKLMREKEQLDLSDSNALLLHPNQYSLAAPGSPGGPSNTRKTRYTRHRAGDPDELVSAASIHENRRKRKAAFDDDNGSPGPTGRSIDFGIGSPFREAKARMIHNQYEAPLLSIENLFSEKELAMTLNHASIAASHFFQKLKTQEANGSSHVNGNGGMNGAVNGVNGDHPNGADAMDIDFNHSAANSLLDPGDATPLGAPEMERQVSHHATRNSTRNNNSLADFAASLGALPFPGSLPTVLPANITSKANAVAPTPAPLAPGDVDNDFQLIARQASPDDAIVEQLLDSATQQPQRSEVRIVSPDDPIYANYNRGLEYGGLGLGAAGSGVRGGGFGGQEQGYTALRDTARKKDESTSNGSGNGLSALAAVDMSRTSSTQGGSDVNGPTLMRRTGSYRGRRGGFGA